MPRRNKLVRRQSKPNVKHSKPKTTIPGQTTKKRPTGINEAQQQQQQKLNKKHKQQQQQHDQPTIPFRPQDRILLIGEGDLSFAASIIRHHGCSNVTATVLERDHDELRAKYPSVDANIEVINRRRPGGKTLPEQDAELAESESKEHDDDDEEEEEEENEEEEDDNEEEKPIIVNNKLIYGVDATKLPSSITRHPHDHIIFNFPHVGGKSTDVNRQVRHNQQLLVSFFQRALSPSSSSSSSSSTPTSSPLAPGGSIIITLFESEPYTLWNIRDLARHAGLQVLKSFRFRPDAYPGYKHARTLGTLRNKKSGEEGGGWKGEDRAARSFVFVRKGEVEVVSKKRKRSGDDDDDSSDEED